MMTMLLDETLEKLKSGKKRGTRNRQFLGDDVLYYFVPARMFYVAQNQNRYPTAYVVEDEDFKTWPKDGWE